ncbi:MAG: putative sugar O-methyltransferase [Candidatus Aenigmarchaeota archaeon]|nr:putative sugar O-methyltransferase [Candidatus Aenigmarchaeota archaeon]
MHNYKHRIVFLGKLEKITMRVVRTIAKSILPPKMYSNLVKRWHKRIIALAERDLKGYLNTSRVDPVLKKMMLSYENSQQEDMPSNYWIMLNRKNTAQLVETGFENFKQTIALNYFTTLLDKNHPQVKFLKKNLSPSTVILAEEKSKSCKRHPFFTPKQSKFYNFVTFMIWKYVQQQVDKDILDRLEEPLIGNPPAVKLNGKWISQDLANSALEFKSISSGVDDFQDIKTILELGAGYGRTAYVILRLNSHIRYIIADIPPALYISQRYLSEVFPDKKIFTFRDFDNFSDVKNEFYNSQIIFLTPNQLKKLPDKTVDLFIAIDCLHEMRPEQIEFYFKTVDRLAKRFYFTCYKKVHLPYEDITLEEKDYIIPPHWKEVFRRTRKIQTGYFEAFFSL